MTQKDYQKHYQSLIQEYRDHTPNGGADNLSEQYLAIFEKYHDDIPDMQHHIHCLCTLASTISRIMLNAYKMEYPD